MRLTLEQIRSVAHGVARVEQVGDTIGFFRFTKEQEESYRLRNKDFYDRTFATAGVTLEMDTDSESLFCAADVSVGCGFRWFTHSIFVDDKRIGELTGFVPENGEPARAEGRFTLEKGMKRIRIVFPWNEVSRIRCLELDDGAVIKPVPKKCRMLIFGDSITQGYTTWLPENSYASRIGRWLDADALNKAIGGEVYWPELSQTREDFQPDLILVAYGANDWADKTEEAFAAHSREFCANLRSSYPQAKIVVLSPIWSNLWAERQKDRWPFEKMYEHLNRLPRDTEGLTVIDGGGFVPWDVACFAEDQVHPNDIGFAYFAQSLKAQLEKILN